LATSVKNISMIPIKTLNRVTLSFPAKSVMRNHMP
jgi:hypothetical protein